MASIVKVNENETAEAVYIGKGRYGINYNGDAIGSAFPAGKDLFELTYSDGHMYPGYLTAEGVCVEAVRRWNEIHASY